MELNGFFHHSAFPDMDFKFHRLVQTQLLETLLIKDYGGSEDVLLGELQFAFIAFLVCADLYDISFLLFYCQL